MHRYVPFVLTVLFVFTHASITVNNIVMGRGSGTHKQRAKDDAAREAYCCMGLPSREYILLSITYSLNGIQRFDVNGDGGSLSSPALANT